MLALTIAETSFSSSATLPVDTTSLGIVFSETVAVQDPLGTSPSNPAYSAKQLLDAEPSSPSGFYWFDTDGPGGEAPFQAFADMTTDGGGWMLAINSVIGSEAPE